MEVMEQAEQILDSIPGVDKHVTISGMSMADGAQISGKASMFVMLKDWEERKTDETSISAIIKRFNAEAYMKIQKATVYGFMMPAIQGLGTSGGYELYVQDKSNMGVVELQKVSEEFAEQANQEKELSGLRTTFKATTPQIFLNIDRDKVKMQKLAISDVFNALSAYLGSSYVNDFTQYGKVYQVRLQAESRNRSSSNDIMRLSVRNSEDKMVPFATFASIEQKTGTEVINRYNMYQAAYMSGNAAEGYSSGQAEDKVARLAKEKFGNTFGFEWTSMAFQNNLPVLQ